MPDDPRIIQQGLITPPTGTVDYALGFQLGFRSGMKAAAKVVEGGFYRTEGLHRGRCRNASAVILQALVNHDAAMAKQGAGMDEELPARFEDIPLWTPKEDKESDGPKQD